MKGSWFRFGWYMSAFWNQCHINIFKILRWDMYCHHYSITIFKIKLHYDSVANTFNSDNTGNKFKVSSSPSHVLSVLLCQRTMFSSGMVSLKQPPPQERTILSSTEAQLKSVDWTSTGFVTSVFLERVQQSQIGSWFALRNFNLQIRMQIGAQMRRTVITLLGIPSFARFWR